MRGCLRWPQAWSQNSLQDFHQDSHLSHQLALLDHLRQRHLDLPTSLWRIRRDLQTILWRIRLDLQISLWMVHMVTLTLLLDHR